MTYFLCYVVSSKIDIRAWRAYNGDMVWELDGTPFLWEGVRIEMTRVSDETIAGVIPMHNHAADSLELHLIVSGTGQIRTQGRTFTLRAGDIFLTVGGEAHEQDSDVREPMQELCIYAAFRRADRLGEAAKTLLSNAFYAGSADEDMLFAARRMERELTSRRTGYLQAVHSCLSMMLTGIARMEERRAGRVRTQLRGGAGDMFLKIEEAFLYRYAMITLPVLAQEVGLSARQLQRVLTGHYGATFSEKRREARMRAALLLLGAGKLPVARIAEETGYSCTEHFCAEFKRYYGMTAGAYRRQRRLSEEVHSAD